MTTAPQRSKAEVLVELLSEHHSQLYRYIHSLVGSPHDARDVLQETSFALYEKFDLFDAERPFLPWAYKFAYIHVLKWREQQSRQMPLLSGDVLELLAKERQSHEGLLNERLNLLTECMKQLPEPDRDLMRARYLDGISPDRMAEKLGASRRTLFRDLKRVRNLLMNCIDQKLAFDEFP